MNNQIQENRNILIVVNKFNKNLDIFKQNFISKKNKRGVKDDCKRRIFK